MFLEVIATSLDDIENINRTKANQIELCSAMEHGGYTPPYELIVQACFKSLKPVRVMVRHSDQSFSFTSEEFSQIKADIAFIKTTHAAGIVCGVLTKNYKLDKNLMSEIVNLAKPLKVTFHRAFDFVLKQENALQQLIELGVDTVLTGGGKDVIINNVNKLKRLKQLKLPVRIMASGGINAKNLQVLLKKDINDIHVGKCVRKNNDYAFPIDIDLIDQLLALDTKKI